MGMMETLMSSMGVNPQELQKQAQGLKDTIVHFDNQLRVVIANQGVINAKLDALLTGQAGQRVLTQEKSDVE